MLNFETVLVDASRLPVIDRIQLIEALWDTLPADCVPPLSDDWIAEVRRRSSQFDSGAAETVLWEQVKTEALHRARLASEE
ncbi:MAG: addiction module protein [Thermoguttaceae bacterium]